MASKCDCKSSDIKTLAHIGVMTPDADASVEFYTEVLGLECYNSTDLTREGKTTKLRFIKAGALIIELVEPADTSGLKDLKAGLIDHIAMAVDDLDAVIERLVGNGIAFETEVAIDLPDLMNGSKTIFFPGPFGERLELFQTGE